MCSNISELVILIAHYNNLKGLKKSLESIREEFPIDLVIVDDGSVEKPDLYNLERWYSNGKIFLKKLESNQGVGVAANNGLEIIKEKKYKYIARLDCGDKCLPNKFKTQINYLKQNPDVKLLGTWVNVINEQGELLYILKHPISYDEIKRKMYINSTFINPTVVFCSEILEKVPGYKFKYRYAAQDYAFFFDVIKFFKAENLPMALLDYEISSNSISTTKRRLQVKNRIKIILDNFEWKPIIFYSLVRNAMLYFFSRDLLEKIKNIFYKK